MKRFIYAVMDKAALAITGGLMVFPADAVAVRTFGDVCMDDQSMVSKHIGDFDLVRLGTLMDDGSIVDVEFTVVVTGVAYVAAQRPMGVS